MQTFLVISALCLGFILCMLAVPPIIRVARAKHLFDTGGGRKIHKKVVPPLGGVAIYIGFTLSTILSSDGLSIDRLKYIFAAILLMFFIGLKDDLMEISAIKKFAVQLFASAILVLLGHVHFTNLYGIFGIYELNPISGVILSLLAINAIINAYNLIDGVDGLASGLAMLASASFGLWFFLHGHVQYSIMSFALAGSLGAFFLYNVFGHTNKLFMGDTGSLIVGLVISTLVIKFNEFSIVDKHVLWAKAPVLSLAIIIVPVVDMLRVMSLRLAQGKSPFSADNNHIHHRLLVLFPKHFTVTMILIAGNIGVIGFAYLVSSFSLNINIQFLMVLALAVLLSFVPSWIIRWKATQQNKTRTSGRRLSWSR